MEDINNKRQRCIMIGLTVFSICCLTAAVLSIVQLNKCKAENKELNTLLESDRQIIEEWNTRFDQLCRKLEDMSNLKEVELESGFIKKGEVYLVETRNQLKTLAEMIENDQEIEPGIPAASASYRLRNDIEVKNWTTLGSKEKPFSGKLDGDGNSIKGLFLPADSEEEAFIIKSKQAEVKNLKIKSLMGTENLVGAGLENNEQVNGMLENVEGFVFHELILSINEGDLETKELAEALREDWDHYENITSSLTIAFDPWSDCDAISASVSMKPFQGLFGEEAEKIIEQAVEEEGGCLRFIKLERVQKLNCCIFGVFGKEEEEYHVLLQGMWEEDQVPLQHLVIPTTDLSDKDDVLYSSLEQQDINFDGMPDLLYREGWSGGSGGSWGNYRGIIWDEKKGEFVYYPSFPCQLAFLEFDRKRMITRGRCGVFYEYVYVYEVVNGEYEETKSLILESNYEEETDDYVWQLSYYEMGELVRIDKEPFEDVKDPGDWAGELYPDMNYWTKG